MANTGGLLLAWVFIYAAFRYAVGPSFSSRGTLETLARQSTIVSLAALGMVFVIVSGGIDLSIGSSVALVTVVIASSLSAGLDPVLAMLLGVAAGLAAGLLNGLAVTKLRLGPFIATLGTLLVFRGLAKGIAHEQKVDAPTTWLGDLLATLGPGERWKLVPPGVWLMLLAAVAVAWVLRSTVFGRRVFALGGNERAALYSAVPVDRVKLTVYIVGGLFAGLAGLMQFSRLTVGDPTVAVGLELDVIAAVVIGGASLSGGQGSVPGALLGALIMTTIRAGGSQMNLPNWVQEIATGLIIIGSVTLDRVRRGSGQGETGG